MASGGFKHLVVVKFKEDTKVDEILKGLENLVSQIDSVKSFKWGEDKESHEMLRQGFTHAFSMTFEKKMVTFLSQAILFTLSSQPLSLLSSRRSSSSISRSPKSKLPLKYQLENILSFVSCFGYATRLVKNVSF